MTDQHSQDGEEAVPARLAADMQDELLAAGTELERLERLLSDAVDQLLDRFGRAHALCGDLHDARQPALAAELRAAMTALQFQDMASQLIVHTNHRLRSCVDTLAREAFGDDDEDGGSVVEAPPQRPNPVTQAEMDAGSVELF